MKRLALAILFAFCVPAYAADPVITTKIVSVAKVDIVSLSSRVEISFKGTGGYRDFIGLFAPGSPNDKFSQWSYVDGSTVPRRGTGTAPVSGMVAFANVPPGKYDARYCVPTELVPACYNIQTVEILPPKLPVEVTILRDTTATRRPAGGGEEIKLDNETETILLTVGPEAVVTVVKTK